MTSIHLVHNISKSVADSVGSNGTPIVNRIWQNERSHERRRHMTPKGQGRDRDTYEA